MLQAWVVKELLHPGWGGIRGACKQGTVQRMHGFALCHEEHGFDLVLVHAPHSQGYVRPTLRNESEGLKARMENGRSTPHNYENYQIRLSFSVKKTACRSICGYSKMGAYRCAMDEPLLPHLEIGAAREQAELSVILMHGLGADAYDFEDVAEALSLAAEPRKWRFVLPNAPTQTVTINIGMHMPAWYDILDMGQPRAVNWQTVAESAVSIEALLGNETAEKIVLAGFSPGAAMALHVGLRHQDDRGII